MKRFMILAGLLAPFFLMAPSVASAADCTISYHGGPADAAVTVNRSDGSYIRVFGSDVSGIHQGSTAGSAIYLWLHGGGDAAANGASVMLNGWCDNGDDVAQAIFEAAQAVRECRATPQVPFDQDTTTLYQARAEFCLSPDPIWASGFGQ